MTPSLPYRSYPSATMALAEGKPGYRVEPVHAAANVRFDIDGLTCAAEATRLGLRLSRLSGILHVTVNPVNEVAYIAFDPAATSPEQIRERIVAEGFGATERP